jgi:hypothetical protein
MEIRPTRRGFLRGVGLSTAVVTIGPAVLPISGLLAAAGAQEAAPTPTQLFAFAESVELAAAAFYGLLRPRLARPAAVALAAPYARHHQDHAASVGPAGGKDRIGKPNATFLPTLTDQLGQARSEADALRIAYDLENSLASTYLVIVDGLTDVADLRLASSILPVEAQHAVALGSLIGRSAKDLTAPDKAQLGYESEDKHIDLAAFPTVVTTTTSAPAAK